MKSAAIALAPDRFTISLTLHIFAAYITDPFNFPLMAGVHKTTRFTPAILAKAQFINAVLGKLPG